MIIDLFFLVLLGGLAARGWSRGFLREGVDVLGLLVGVFLAFRLAPVLGIVVAAMSGMSDDGARLTAGLLILAGSVVAIIFGGRALDRRMAGVELRPLDRGAGTGLAVTWGVFLLTILVTLASLSPLPPTIEGQFASSTISRALADPDGAPQAVFARLAGDRIIGSLLSLQRLFGDRRVVIGPEDRIEIPPANPEDLREDPHAAADVFERLNRARVDAGLDPLAWSDALADVARGHAYDMYLNGFFSHRSPTTGGLSDRLRAASIPFRVAGENLALAATPADVHRGLMDSPGHRANILGAEYRRVGVAVVSGRLGLMAVQVFTG
jgi:uncharacterized membrane protein required for colicin V production